MLDVIKEDNGVKYEYVFILIYLKITVILSFQIISFCHYHLDRLKTTGRDNLVQESEETLYFPNDKMLIYFFIKHKISCLIMSRDVENDDEEVDTEHEKRKRRVIFILLLIT